MPTMHQPLLSTNDYRRSKTAFTISSVTEAVCAASDGEAPSTILDVGCGYGGIAATLQAALHAREAHGVDIDESVAAEVETKGVQFRCVDVSSSCLPYEDGYFDLVTCFGMLDYLPVYDTAVVELSRVLRPNGLIAIALPNLAGWTSRLALLLGYQPCDIEFCSVRAVGVAPFYRNVVAPGGHIHTPTTRAFRQFMTLMGFDEVRVVPLRPTTYPTSWPLRAIDAVLGRSVSLSRRFLYLGRKHRDPETPSEHGWWANEHSSTLATQRPATRHSAISVEG